MPLRESSTLPGRPVDIARFLATSLTFMRNLQDVSMFFNEHRLVHVKKSMGHPRTLPLLPTLDPKTKIGGLMMVKEVQSSGAYSYVLASAFIADALAIQICEYRPKSCDGCTKPEQKNLLLLQRSLHPVNPPLEEGSSPRSFPPSLPQPPPLHHRHHPVLRLRQLIH